MIIIMGTMMRVSAESALIITIMMLVTTDNGGGDYSNTTVNML